MKNFHLNEIPQPHNLSSVQTHLEFGFHGNWLVALCALCFCAGLDECHYNEAETENNAVVEGHAEFKTHTILRLQLLKQYQRGFSSSKRTAFPVMS